MATKKQIKCEDFCKWLDTVIEPISIIRDFPKLIGTGIVFHEFVFKPGVIMLKFSITPHLCKQFPVNDQHKYDVDLSGKTAFSFRSVNGVSDSPVIYPHFIKLMEDNEKNVNKSFKYISNWVNNNQEKFKVIR